MTSQTAFAPRVATVAIVLMVMSSIAFLPGGLNRWVLPKDAVMVVAALCATLAVPAGKLPRWLWGAMLGAGLLLVISAMFSSAPLAQLLGRFPRYEGAVSLPVYAIAVWSGARLLGPASGDSRRAVLTRASSAAAVLLGGVALLESVGLRPIPSNLARPGSLTGNATDQGAVGVLLIAVLIVPVIRYFFPDPTPRSKRSRPQVVDVTFPWAAAFGLLFAIAAVVTSASRAALVGSVVVVVVVAVAEIIRARHQGMALKARVLFATGAPIVLVAAALAVPLTRARLLGESPLAGQSAADRLVIWRQAIEVLLRHPLLGVGPSGFVDAVPAVEGADWYPLRGSAPTLDSPHNWILQAAVSGGALLGLAAVATAVAVLIVGYRRWRRSVDSHAYGDADLRTSALAGLLAFAVVLLTGFTAPSAAIPAAMLVGIAVAVPPRPLAAERIGWAAARTLSVGVWAVLLLISALSEIPLAQATTAASLKDVPGAEAQFDLALALRPWDADTDSIAAQTFAHLADGGITAAAQPAVRYARAALRWTPQSVSARMALIIGLQVGGDSDQSLAEASSLAQRVPRDPDVLLRLANAQWGVGQRTDAEETLLRVTRMIPADPRPWAALEAAYRADGDDGAADDAAAQVKRLSG